MQTSDSALHSEHGGVPSIQLINFHALPRVPELQQRLFFNLVSTANGAFRQFLESFRTDVGRAGSNAAAVTGATSGRPTSSTPPPKWVWIKQIHCANSGRHLPPAHRHYGGSLMQFTEDYKLHRMAGLPFASSGNSASASFAGFRSSDNSLTNSLPASG